MFKKWTNKRNLELIEAMRKNIFDGFSMAELEKKLKLSHHPAYRRVKQLEKDKIVFRKDGSYRLNISNPETAEILYFLSRKEKLEFAESFVNDLFRQLERQFDESNETEIAIIFGSYAIGS